MGEQRRRTVPEVAAKFRRNPKTIRRYIAAGLIRAVSDAGRIWVEPEEVEKLRRHLMEKNGLIEA